MEEELSVVLETCSFYIKELDDLEPELNVLDSIEEWDTNSQQDIAKEETGFNQKMSLDSSFFKQSISSGMPVEERQNLDICKVINLLWSKPSVRSMVKELELKVCK
jgi:hypothetical protein